MLKIKNILLFFGACCLAIFLFWGSIVSKTSEWAIQWYAHHKLGSRLTYASFEALPGKFIFHHPLISKKNQTSLAADSLTITYEWQWLERKLNLDVAVENLDIQWGEGQVDLHHLLQRSKSTSLIKVEGKLAVKAGKVQLVRPEKENAPAPIFFNGSLDWGRRMNGKFHATVGDPANQHLLDVEFAQEKHGPAKVLLEMIQLPLNDTLELVKAFLPHPWTWEAEKGVGDGHLLIEISPEGIPATEGKIALHELQIRQPSLGASASISQAILSVGPNLTAVLEVNAPSSLSFANEGNVFAFMQDVQGKIALLPEHKLDFDLCGNFLFGRETSQVFLKGRAHEDILLQMQIAHENSHTAMVHLSLKKWSSGESPLELGLTEVRNQEFDVFQRFLQVYAPQYHLIRLQNGTVDGLFTGTLKQFKLHDFSIEHFLGKHVLLEIPDWDILLGAEELHGHGALNLSFPRPIDTLNGEMNVKNGFVKLIGINQEFWQFHNVQTKLLIRQGFIHDSTASVELAGLKGQVELNWICPQEVMQISLSGYARDLHRFVPALVQNAILREFHDDHLAVVAKIFHHERGVRVNGDIMVSSPLAPLGDKIHFGFDLDKNKTHLLGTGPDASQELYWKRFLPNVTRLMAPHFAGNKISTEPSWHFQDFNIGDLVLRNGWFEAKELEFGKYVSPFLFPEGSFDLEATGDVRGNFDFRELVVRYCGKEVFLENGDLAIQVPKVQGILDSSDPTCQFQAFHYFDLQNFNNFGYIPIHDATYVEKNTGLVFTDIEADVLFEGDKIYLPKFEAFCEGISFAAQLEIDNSLPGKGFFDLDVAVQDLHGDFSNLKKVLTRFPSCSFLTSLPLKGKVALRDPGAHFHFAFRPGENDYDIHLYGAFMDGEVCCDNADIAFKDISLNFEYDQKKRLLDFSELQGALLIGAPKHAQEFFLAGNQIKFDNFEKYKGSFDVWVSDGQLELFRVSGFTQPIDNNKFNILFDSSLTHFDDLYPSNIALTMRDGFSVDNFNMNLDFKLETLVRCLTRFTPSGFMFLSRHMMEEISTLSPAQGQMSANLSYDSQTARTSFSLEGKDVKFKTYDWKNLCLKGNKRDNFWMIDALQIDNLNLSADLVKHNEDWTVNYLGARYGKSLLIGMEGLFNGDNQRFDGHVNLFEADFAHLNELEPLKETLKPYAPEGIFRGTGEITIEKRYFATPWHIEALLKGSLKNGQALNLKLDDIDHISLHYVTGKGLTLQNIQTTIKDSANPEKSLAFSLDKFDHDLHYKGTSFEGLNFNIDASNLPWLAHILLNAFPDQLDSNDVEAISHLKKSGSVKGVIFLEQNPSSRNYKIHLEDGLYHFLDGDHLLKDFSVEKDETNFRLVTRYQHHQHSFWIEILASGPDFNKGQMILSNVFPSDATKTQPLIVHFENDPINGFCPKRIKGQFCGLNANLAEESTNPSTVDAIKLSGSLQINAMQARHLLPEEYSQKILESLIGKGYQLNGYFEVKRKDRAFSFDGDLEGRNFEWKGYQFQHLGATLRIDPGVLTIENLKIKDPAVTAKVEQMRFQKNQNFWMFHIPQITVQNLRPSLLREAGNLAPFNVKPLLVDHISIQNVKGLLGETNTYTGSGKLHFINPTHNNLQNPIFAIPAEIINRIGLNMGVLTPVRGSVIFHFADGKIQLTKFKDMYSQNKLSKFYLTNSYDSYVDYEGNLHVQVRMKQYNLLFKLAELFTVTVEGSLLNPTYALQKNARDDEKYDRSTAYWRLDNL